MGGRKWTDEELVLLEELTEKYPLETVARRLNRTKEAVFLKRQRIGMGGYMANTDMLTRNTVSKILGIENRTLQYWERKGLKSYRKRPYVMYRQEDIIKYMREHPEDWNAARVTDDTMFMRYDWYKEKRKNDISRRYNWTGTEVRRMQHFRHEGYSIREIAEKLMEKGLVFFDVLREHGFGHLITERVDPRTLDSAMNNLAAENDGELPEEMAEVLSVYSELKVSKRKANTKALNRAKKAQEV